MSIRGIINQPIAFSSAYRVGSKAGTLPRLRQVRFAGRDVTVMSFNLDHFAHLEGEQNEKKARAIAAAILPHDPDVIALQEVRDQETVKSLNQVYLKGKYPNIVCIEYEDSQRLAILSKKDLPLTETALFYKGDNFDMLRGLLRVTVEPQGVEPLYLYNMHLQAGGSKKRREAQVVDARIGRAYIEKAFTENPDGFYMLVGDGNVVGDDHGRRVLDILSGNQQQNPRTRLVEVFENAQGRVYTWKSGKKQAKLDYAFISPNLLMRVRESQACGKVNPEASDHRPIKVTVRLPDLSRAASHDSRNVGKDFGTRVSLFA